jgi:hypothetical protein
LEPSSHSPFSGAELNLPKLASVIFTVLKYVALACLVYCTVGLGLSLRRNGPLWLAPLRAEGRVTGHREVSWQSTANETSQTVNARLPLVTFKDAQGIPRTFTDRFDHGTVRGQAVPVIYAKSSPNLARIDRGLLNGLETAIWLFGVIGGLLGTIHFPRARRRLGLRAIS